MSGGRFQQITLSYAISRNILATDEGIGPWPLSIYGRCFRRAGRRVTRPGPLGALSKAKCRLVDSAPSGRDENSTWVEEATKKERRL